VGADDVGWGVGPGEGCGVGAFDGGFVGADEVGSGVGPGEGCGVGAFDGGSVGDGEGKPKHLHSTGVVVGYSHKEIQDDKMRSECTYIDCEAF